MDSSTTASTRGVGNQEEEFDYATVKKVIDTLTSDIITVLYPELGSVLDQAKGIGLIGPEMYGQYKDASDAKNVARKFLEVAMGQCSMDHSKVKSFLEIFENTPSLEIISKRIQGEMRKLEKEKAEESSTMTTSDDFALPPQQCHTPRQFSEQSSTTSLKSVKSVDSVSGGIQERSSPGLKGVTFRNFPNVPESAEESDISETVSIAEPQEAFARSRQLYRNVTDKAQMRMESMNNTYQQAKEALPLGDPFQKEVSEKLDVGMQVTGQYYTTYMTISQKRQREIDELEKRYDIEFQKLKKKHEAMVENDSRSEQEREEQEREEKDLKSKYSQDALKFAEDGKLLEDQVNLQGETSSVEVLQVKIEYEKKINELSNKLNHEIHSLKDEIASLKDEITALKLAEKVKENESLQAKLEKTERKLQKLKEGNS